LEDHLDLAKVRAENSLLRTRIGLETPPFQCRFFVTQY